MLSFSRSRRIPVVLSVAVAVFLAAGVLVPAMVLGSPVTNAKIEERQKEAAAAEAKLEDLQADLEERAEEYAEISERLDQTTADLARTQEEVREATARLDASRRRLAERANAIYRGGTSDVLAVFLDVSDFNDFVARIDLMARIGRSDAHTVEQVKADRELVQRAEADLENRRAEQVVLRREAGEKQAEVEHALQAQSQYLDSVNAEVAKLIEEERERQRKLAEERARKAAEAAAAAARRAEATSARARADVGELGAPHPEVVAVAMRYLGVPYVWGGTTPQGFDCSGLCLYSYREIGISLPRTSREQFRVGAYIPPNRRDLLKAGDLVFFGRDGDPDRVHHVGIYVGDDDYLHAPYTGANVMVSSLSARISSRGDYVGATRP